MKVVQAKHIDTAAFVAEVARRESEHLPRTPRAFADHFGVPLKVMQEKIDKLDRRGLVEGCGCGCSSPVHSIRDHAKRGA